MRRIVFDTNIYISAFITPGGRGEAAYRKAIDGHIQPFSSVPILDELARKLLAKSRWDTPRVTVAVRHVAAVATVLKPPIQEPRQDSGVGGFVVRNAHYLKQVEVVCQCYLLRFPCGAGLLKAAKQRRQHRNVMLRLFRRRVPMPAYEVAVALE